MLSIKFLGKVIIKYNEENITDKFGAKTKALLALLVLNETKMLNREKIISYLWPDSSEESGRFNLRFNLWQLRNLIGEDEKGNKFLYTTKKYCSINNSYLYNCDISDIKLFNLNKNISIENLEEIKEKFRGDFLEGFYFKNCDEFNETIILERSYFEDQKVKILLKLIDLYEIENKYEKCIEILRQLINIEPYDEEIAFKIMDIYEKSERRSSAIVFYDNFKKKLLTSLGIEPSKKLEYKYLTLKSKDLRLEGYQMENKKIIIEISCIGEIKYYCISDFLEKLINLKFDIKNYLNDEAIRDLSYISSKLLKEELTTIPSDVRIIKALLILVAKISKEYKIVIKIDELKRIDNISKIFFEEIKRKKLIEISL